MKIYKLSQKQIMLGAAVLATFCAVSLFVESASKQTQQQIATLPVINDIQKVPAVDLAARSEKILLPATASTATQSIAQAPAHTESQAAPLSPWRAGDLKAPTPTIPLNEKIVSYTIVQLEQHPASFPAVGQQVEFPMLNGKKIVVDVQLAAQNPNGDYTWSGHLQGHGDDYPVVMTYGQHSIFATITSPEGSYTMESVEGLGWLYKNPAEVEMSNPGANDYLDVNPVQ